MADDIPREPVPFRLLVRTCSLLATGTGFVALLGWVLPLPFLTSFGSGQIPMAPSTALLFVLYGIAAFLCAHLPMHRGAYRVSLVLIIVGTLVVLPLFFLSLLGINPVVEHLGFQVTGKVGGAPIGHMSPVTALCFLVASLSFFALPPSFTDRSRRARAAWWLASLLVATSFVLLLAYLFGTPLFYDGSFIPPAATTSVAFVALGIALLGLALPHARVLRGQDEQTTRTEYALILVFLLLAAGIVTVGYLYHLNYERRYRNEVESQLSAIADLKVSEVVQYRKERLGDAAIFFRNASFSSMVRRFLEQPGDAGARRQLREWIGNYGAQYESDRVFLLDTRGVTRIWVPEMPEPVASTISQRAPEIVRLGQVAFQDFYRNEHNRKIYLAVLIPIFDEREGERPLGVLALRIDPEKYLYPLISHWPTPSRTAETLLVRRDGNDVLFLNELRFGKNTALTLRFPLDPGSDLPAVKAVLGKKGIVEGRDYRGKPVLADVREVPDSPWFVVARMDLSEVYEPARERLWWTVSLVCVLLLAAGSGVVLAWRQQRARFYRERYEVERERAWLQDVISRSLDEIYVFDPRTLRFKFVNTGGLRNIGYSMEELASLTLINIDPEYTEEAFRAMVQPLIAGEREVLVFETVHRRKDGSEYPVEVHLQHVSAAGGVVFLAIVNDITERKRAEEERRKLERQLQTAQKMESVGTLAGGIAHDFNNVLTVIIGHGEMLKPRIVNDPKAISDLDEILRSAERASVLTRQILTFARRQIIELGNLDLNRVVTDLEKLLRKVTREDIEIKTFLAEGLPTIRADQGQVEQVLMNLSLNARDAMPGGGQLVVETQEAWLDEEYVKQYPYMKAGRYSVLSVSDTGIGMDEKTRERIFEPFFTTKGPDKGTGLGLAVVYGIVKQHNGFIHVYSEPGKGTTFRTYFPAVDVPPD
ncbi:MAG: ATP-binding protein, partial [Candidatus Deferrimicrobiaceae bacterium]